MSTLKEHTVELEQLTKVLLRVLNSQDFSYQSADGKRLLNHIAPDFEARFDTLLHTIDFEAQTQIWRQNAHDYPSLQFSVLELTTNIRPRSSTASVYLKLALDGMSDVRYQGSCELNWRQAGNEWFLYRHVTMRGPLSLGY